MTKLPSMTSKDIDLLSRDRQWDGFYKLDVLKLRHRRYDGSWTGELEREVLERKHVVAVIPYDPKTDQVVLIEQFRAPTISANADFPELPVWLIEIVAGIVGDGESPEETARREIVEEINVEPYELRFVSRFFASQGCTSEHIGLYCALIDAPTDPALLGEDAEDEDIYRFTVSRTEAMEMITSGKICNASAILALQWLQLNYQHLMMKAQGS